MNVLITGAASQLGQQIIAALVSNHQLRLLDSTMPDIKHENLEFIQGSIVDPKIANE
ncbi:TPA: NAD(P)-dependent oxidoreductase, partial [Candidatus Poribacteria bacterium]|nr:NAD(P)-dependent oxidoreductase [Candidatus Poribacteria bacterium]